MTFLCPECEGKSLNITAKIELPPDARSDKITLQVVECARCRFFGLAVYEASRRGALGDSSSDHVGYRVSFRDLTAVRRAIERCPNPANPSCGCSSHRMLAVRDAVGRWDGLRTFRRLGIFELRRESGGIVKVRRLTTARLELIPATGALARAELEDLETLFRLLGVEWAPDWPPADTVDALPVFAEQLERNPALVGWLSWYWVLGGERSELVGNGGFKGRPGPEGAVEIGYFVRSRFRRRGIAAEAATRLVAWAFESPQVTHVIAETTEGNVASTLVLQRLGFKRAGAGSECGLVRFELAREDLRPSIP
jgi:ribosomal-protein-alanine N-acetyltransferase